MRGNNHEGNREEIYKIFPNCCCLSPRPSIYHLTHIIYQEKRGGGIGELRNDKLMDIGS